MSRWFLMALFVPSLYSQTPAAAEPPAKTEAPAKKSALDKQTLESYLRHQFLINSQFAVQVADPKPSEVPGMSEVRVVVTDGKSRQEVVFLVTADGQKIIQGKVFDIADNPFRSDLNLLKTEGQPAIGTPGAPVVVVAFSDFQCAFCREEARMLRKNLLQNYPTKVRLYFKDMPIEQIHPWAKPAATLGRCVFRQSNDAFWNFHDWVFEQQNEIANPVILKTKALEWAAAQKIDALQLTRCFDEKETEKDVERSVAEAMALQINSTPTLFVNGRKLVGQMAWEQLRNVIDAEIEYQKTAKNAGDACCEVKAAVPGVSK